MPKIELDLFHYGTMTRLDDRGNPVAPAESLAELEGRQLAMEKLAIADAEQIAAETEKLKAEGKLEATFTHSEAKSDPSIAAQVAQADLVNSNQIVDTTKPSNEITPVLI